MKIRPDGASGASPYSRVGSRLVSMGYHAIPVLPGSKRPGMFSRGHWYGENDWQRFCDRAPTGYEIPVWKTWPDAGVCIALDDTVKVVDIDTDDPSLIAAVEAVLPKGVARKRGAKGYSAFYRGSPAIVSRPFNVRIVGQAKPVRVVDLLAKGRQTILPPTVHPDTEREYVWLDDDSLTDYEIDDLPVLPDDVAERIAVALTPFGYTDEEVRRDMVGVESGDSVWREIKDLALANLDAWVPELGLPLAKRYADKPYRAVAVWRGGDGYNVSFHESGIRDMAQDQGLTPIDVVMKALSLDDRAALQWLKDQLGYTDPWLPHLDFSAIIANGMAKPNSDSPIPAITAAQAEAHAAGADPVTGEIIETEIVATHDGSGLPPALCIAPGLVGDIVEWLNRSARNPSPTLNLGAALAYVGALAGRRYEGPTGLRTNVYVVGLAPSGFGKEHPRAGTKSLASASGTLTKFFGGNKIASSSALRNRVKKSPALVYMIDEFGGFLRKVTSQKSGNHEKEIAEDLLEMTGTAASIFMGADYAQSLAEPIHNPNVCIYGTSTPDAFWKALGSGSIADGFLPRFVLLDAGTARPRPRDATASVNAPPKALVERIQAFVSHRNGGNMNGMTSDGSTACIPIQAAWGDGAKRSFDAFVDVMFRAMDSAAPEQEPIWARVAENAMRLALIAAAGTDPERPVITADMMNWATDVAHRSAKMLLAQVEDRVADNDRQAEYKRVRSIIASYRRNGTNRSDVARRLNGIMDRRRMNDVIDQLVEAGSVIQTEIKTANNRSTYRLYGELFAPVAAEIEAETT